MTKSDNYIKKGVPKFVDIRKERIARGWSQKQLADSVGVSQTAIHSIEALKRNPSYSVYIKLMSLFGYEAPRLVAGTSGGEFSNLNESISKKSAGSKERT